MIQKIQRLKAKKGFTLVELIVVIAIIGVLAAILIPTMLNFVTQANVASANATTAKIQDDVDQWLLNLNTKGDGMKLAGSVEGKNYFKATASATGWTIAPTFEKDNWNGTAAPTATEMQNSLGETLKVNYPSLLEAGAEFIAYVENGICKYVVANLSGSVPTSAPSGTKTAWVYTTSVFSQEGVLASDGTLIGTSPAIKK